MIVEPSENKGEEGFLSIEAFKYLRIGNIRIIGVPAPWSGSSDVRRHEIILNCAVSPTLTLKILRASAISCMKALSSRFGLSSGRHLAQAFINPSYECALSIWSNAHVQVSSF